MTKRFLTATAVLALLTATACSKQEENAAAQGADNAGNAVENGFSDAGTAMDNAGHAVANGFDDAKVALTPTPTAQEFVDRAAASDAYEIAAAKLAKTNAASAEVKAFAAMMITAHTDSTAKIKKAAAAASPALTPNPALDDDKRDDLAKLKDLKGKDFDDAYIDQQIDAHEKTLNLMKVYADKGDVAPLKTAAGEIAPVVDKHLTEARKLDDRH